MKSILLCLFIVFSYALLNAQSADSINQLPAIDTAGNVTKPGSVRQVDLIDFLVKIFKEKDSEEKRDERKVKFSLFPSASGKSGGKTIVTSFNATFRLGDTTNTSISTLYFVPYVSFSGQYGFQLQPNIWLSKNRWNFTGEYFIMNYPQATWGLGGNTPDKNETLIDYKHLRIHQNALKGIMPHIAVGLGYALDYHYNILVENTELGEKTKYYLPADRDYLVSSGLTLSMLWDTRRSTINPQQGIMSSSTFSFFSPFLGSTDKYQSLFLDVRKYFPLTASKNHILALRSYYWTIVTGNAPYLDLPANRWEPISGSSSRGMQQNRYRSNAILYFETEYRFGITANGLLGGVLFASATSASQFGTQQFLYWHPAGGAGIRVKFNKYSRTNVTLDYGFSKGYQSVYLNIGEAF
jgi:hypothetical protein